MVIDFIIILYENDKNDEIFIFFETLDNILKDKYILSDWVFGHTFDFLNENEILNNKDITFKEKIYKLIHNGENKSRNKDILTISIIFCNIIKLFGYLIFDIINEEIGLSLDLNILKEDSSKIHNTINDVVKYEMLTRTYGLVYLENEGNLILI